MCGQCSVFQGGQGKNRLNVMVQSVKVVQRHLQNALSITQGFLTDVIDRQIRLRAQVCNWSSKLMGRDSQQILLHRNSLRLTAIFPFQARNPDYESQVPE